MSRTICNFHQNLIIWKKDGGGKFWNAFGFFGKGGAGKTTLTFILAKLLVEKNELMVRNGTSLKVIDDNFTLENRVVSSSDWGSDKLGKQQLFIDSLRALGHSDIEARPNKGEFQIATFIGWLLVCDNNVPKYTITKSTRDEFVNILLGLDPCHSHSQAEINLQPRLREEIRERFDVSWNYCIVRRHNTQSAEDEPMLEDLALKAYEDWHQYPLFSQS
ncbi:MAG: hypothetical protein ACLPY5_02945 [Candidatus Bathyarchaeia archaeon]